MVSGILGRGSVAVEHRTGCDIDLTANDRLHSRFACSLIKWHSRMQVAMIRHCDRWHAEGGGLFHQLTDAHRGVEKRKFGMAVQMNKRHGR